VEFLASQHQKPFRCFWSLFFDLPGKWDYSLTNSKERLPWNV